LNSLSAKVWRRVASLPADIALGMTNVAPISSYLDQRKSAIEESYVAANSLSPNEAAVVDGLHRDGVFVTSLDSLGIAQAENVPILRSGAEITQVLAQRVASLSERHPAAICNTPADLLANPPIYRWGLHPTLLRIVEAYLRQPVAYDGPIVFYTEANKKEEGTRMWHLDREDRRVVKVALYLHDVGETVPTSAANTTEQRGTLQVSRCHDNNPRRFAGTASQFDQADHLHRKGRHAGLRGDRTLLSSRRTADR
jgi:hypothetical protein